MNIEEMFLGGVVGLCIASMMACIGFLLRTIQRLINRIEEISLRNITIDALNKGNLPVARGLAGIAAQQNKAPQIKEEPKLKKEKEPEKGLSITQSL
jgi:hypothetical protein